MTMLLLVLLYLGVCMFYIYQGVCIILNIKKRQGENKNLSIKELKFLTLYTIPLLIIGLLIGLYLINI